MELATDVSYSLVESTTHLSHSLVDASADGSYSFVDKSGWIPCEEGFDWSEELGECQPVLVPRSYRSCPWGYKMNGRYKQCMRVKYHGKHQWDVFRKWWHKIFWPEEVPPVVLGSPLWRAKRPVRCPWGYSWTSRERRKCSRIKYHAVQQPDFLRKVFGWFVPITTKRPTTLYMPWSDSEEKPSTKRPRKKPPREDNEGEEGGGAGEGGAGGGGDGGGLDEAGPGGGGPAAGGDGPAGGPAGGGLIEGPGARGAQRTFHQIFSKILQRNGRGGEQPAETAAPKADEGVSGKAEAPANKWIGRGRLLKAPQLAASEEQSDEESEEISRAARARRKREKKVTKSTTRAINV